MHLKRLLPIRTVGLQVALYFFFKPPANHNKISFPFSNVYPLLLSHFLLPSLSGCKALKDAKTPPSLTLSVVTTIEHLHPKLSKPFSTLSLKCLLYQELSSPSAPPHFSSPSALESPTISLGTPTYSIPPLVTRWTVGPS